MAFVGQVVGSASRTQARHACVFDARVVTCLGKLGAEALVVGAEADSFDRAQSKATTDVRDFGAYRWKRRKPFRNLMKV